MRVFLILSLAFCLLFLPLATASGAEETKSKASSKQYHRTHGEIASVDATAQTITVKHGGDASTFKIDSSTKLRGVGKEIAFADLQVGDDVRVSYTEDGTDKIAARIDVAHKKDGTDDSGVPCKVGYHRCGYGDCCKD
jgi:Cu/Ag efflux protein CusF